MALPCRGPVAGVARSCGVAALSVVVVVWRFGRVPRRESASSAAWAPPPPPPRRSAPVVERLVWRARTRLAVSPAHRLRFRPLLPLALNSPRARVDKCRARVPHARASGRRVEQSASVCVCVPVSRPVSRALSAPFRARFRAVRRARRAAAAGAPRFDRRRAVAAGRWAAGAPSALTWLVCRRVEGGGWRARAQGLDRQCS